MEINKYEKSLKQLCKMCEQYINSIKVEDKQGETYDIHHCGHQMCPFRTIDNDYCEDIETLQELIDICSKPNSIKSKLDHIQDVIDSCYETDMNGKHYESDWNNDVILADEELQDIKQAYSFRVEDTRIVNELKELLGVNADFIKARVEELLKKELENGK